MDAFIFFLIDDHTLQLIETSWYCDDSAVGVLHKVGQLLNLIVWS